MIEIDGATCRLVKKGDEALEALFLIDCMKTQCFLIRTVCSKQSFTLFAFSDSISHVTERKRWAAKGVSILIRVRIRPGQLQGWSF